MRGRKLFSALGQPPLFDLVDDGWSLNLLGSALKSPQLLELSGIGDRRVLEPLGIETKVDLPGVGANAQDHIICSVNFG